MTVALWTLAPLVVLHILAWRRWPETFRFQLLLDVVLLAALGPAILTGRDLNPVRAIERRPPFQHVEWSASTAYQPTQSDLVLQFHPWWDGARRQLLDGRLPLIAPEIGGGMPLVAHGQVGLWAPVKAPVWVLGPERGTTVMALWKLELAGLGAFLLLRRRLRLRWSAATVGGIGWAGTPYLVAWLLVPLAWVTAALPWAWWLALRAVGRRNGRAWCVGAGLGFGWLMGSGLHPETAAIVSGSALLAALISSPRRWLRVAAVLAGSGLVALVLAWPTLGAIASSSRAAVTAESRPNLERPPVQLQGALAAQAAVPMVHGRPGRHWTAAYPYAPGAVGAGGAVLVLAAAWRWRRRHRRVAWAAGAGGVLGLVLMLRIPPLDWLLVRVPPIDHMTLVRWGVLIPWALVVLAALAMDAWRCGNAPKRWPGPWIMVAALGAVALLEHSWRLAPAGLVGVAATLAAAGLVAWRPDPRLVVAVVVIELGVLSVGVNPAADPGDRLPETRVVSFLQERAAGTSDRVIGLAKALPPNLASRYGLADLRASDPVRPRPFVRMMRVMGEPDTILGGPLDRLPAGLLGAWGVRWAVTPPARRLAGAWQVRLECPEGRVYENPLVLAPVRVVGGVQTAPRDLDALRSAITGMDFARRALVDRPDLEVRASLVDLEVKRDLPAAVVVETRCDGPCLLVVARPWAPGWRARLDGDPAPVVIADIAGMGVVAPPGVHSVELEYRLRLPIRNGLGPRD